MTDDLDKAGKGYWDGIWNGRSHPDRMNLNDFVDSRFDKFFSRIFSPYHTEGMSLLEVGCAASTWLPYFSQKFGFDVSGLDYSEIGAAQSRFLLERDGINGNIVLADMFAPPPELHGAFDVVISNGVIEHFKDTTLCFRSLSKFVKPGGTIVTVIPNLTGAIGSVQKFLHRGIYDVHVPLTREMLRARQEEADLEVVECEYFMFTHFGVCVLDNTEQPPLRKRMIKRLFEYFSYLVWRVEMWTQPFRPGPFLSGHVVSVARHRNIV